MITAYDDTRPPDHRKSLSSLQWRVFILCGLVTLLDGFDIVVAALVVPSMSEQWGIKPANFGAALAAGIAGTGLGAAFIARLGDRLGRRPVLIASFVAVGAFSTLTALSKSPLDLSIYRFMTGLALGASLANALALASEFAPSHLRSRLLTIIYAFSGIGGVASGSLAPILIKHLSWQGVFVFGGITPLFIAVILFFALPESHRFVAVKKGISAGAVKEREHDDRKEPVFAKPGLSVLISAPYRRATLLLWILYFVSAFSTYLLGSWLPTILRTAGWSIADSVRGLVALSLGGVLIGVLLGWLADRGFLRL